MGGGVRWILGFWATTSVSQRSLEVCVQESSTPGRPDWRRWQLRGTPSPALGPVVSESNVTQSPKASREAYGTPGELAAYKWVGKIKAGPDREEGRRQEVPLGARNGC